MTEIACCHVPAQRFSWQEPNPTVQSWLAAHDVGIRYVRMSYDRLDTQWFQPAYRAAIQGGLKVTIDFGVGKFDKVTPELLTEIEQQAFQLATQYPDAYSFSFENEPGGKVEMSPQATVLDIDQGGTLDWIKDVYGPLCLAYMRGIRRARPDVLIDLFDADSTGIQRRCMAFLVGTEFKYDNKIRWTAHNYADIGGDPAKGIPSNQDYSSMAGMNGKEGFLDVFRSDPLCRPWYISEISKVTGDFGGIATPSDMQRLIEYVRMMLAIYPQCPIITIMTPKCFFTRTPVWSARQPDITKPDADTWSTWTYGPKPIVSVHGAQLAALFNPPRRRASRP